MKIDNISQLPGAQAVGERKSNDDTTAGADSAAVESSSISQLRRPAAENSQDIDSARVAEIRQAIADGQLEIRADRIADGLIDSVREILETREQ